MKILLTGATGFIGSHVARCLVRHHHKVVALIRKESRRERITDFEGAIKIVNADVVSDSPLLPHRRAIGACDACIHLAWYVEPGLYLESPRNDEYLSASIRLAGELPQIGCNRLIAAGTCFEYNHDQPVALTEQSAAGPITRYARTKRDLFITLQGMRDLRLTWMRFFYLYGPQEHARRLVPHTINSLLRQQPVRVAPGKLVRDYLHVEDVADAVLALVEHPTDGPVNIGSGVPVTVQQVATTIGELLGRTALIQEGTAPAPATDPVHVLADNTLLRRATGWTPRYTLRSGLEQTITWWQRQNFGD